MSNILVVVTVLSAIVGGDRDYKKEFSDTHIEWNNETNKKSTTWKNVQPIFNSLISLVRRSWYRHGARGNKKKSKTAKSHLFQFGFFPRMRHPIAMIVWIFLRAA